MKDMDLAPREYIILFTHLDNANSGCISVNHLIALIRTPPRDRTINLLKEIFNYLDIHKRGAIDIAYMMRCLNVEHHMDVLSGVRKKAEVLLATVQAFDGVEDVQEEAFLRFHM